MTTATKKKPSLKLAGRPPAEVGVIVAAIACGVVVLAVLMQWLFSGEGLLAIRHKREATDEQD